MTTPCATAVPRVLYIVYWGAAEPLGQSLVLPAIERLAERGARVTLVTFDKAADFRDRERMASIRARLEAQGVRWIALRYHKRPRVPATSWDVLHGWARAVTAGAREPVDVVHARTFVGGLIGRLVAATLRTKLVYHNEGFYPDEQVDGGFWAQGSAWHRLTKALETRLYAAADGLIALSHRAQAVVEDLPAVRRKKTPVIVVPSCVDLDRFRLDPDRSRQHDGLSLVYTGAVGGRYVLDRVGRFVSVLAERRPDVRLSVLTRAEPALVTEMLDRGGLLRDAWSLDCLPHEAMPAELARHDAGLFFLTQGLSEHGCSPTKVGEYWACGLPVVTTPNVSDTDALIREWRAGVVVAGHDDESYRRAAAELEALLADADLPRRCRKAAEAHYALAAACDRQFVLYQKLLAGEGA